MTDDRILKLLDMQDIRDLRIRYSHCLDSGNIDALETIFSPDAEVEVTVGSMRGIAEIKSGLADAFAMFDRDKKGSYPFMHAVTNHAVTLTGKDTAEGRCYLMDFETASKADPHPLFLLGIYADQYRRIDGRWLITGSRLETIWPERNG